MSEDMMTWDAQNKKYTYKAENVGPYYNIKLNCKDKVMPGEISIDVIFKKMTQRNDFAVYLKDLANKSMSPLTQNNTEHGYGVRVEVTFPTDAENVTTTNSEGLLIDSVNKYWAYKNYPNSGGTNDNRIIWYGFNQWNYTLITSNIYKFKQEENESIVAYYMLRQGKVTINGTEYTIPAHSWVYRYWEISIASGTHLYWCYNSTLGGSNVTKLPFYGDELDVTSGAYNVTSVRAIRFTNHIW